MLTADISRSTDILIHEGKNDEKFARRIQLLQQSCQKNCRTIQADVPDQKLACQDRPGWNLRMSRPSQTKNLYVQTFER